MARKSVSRSPSSRAAGTDGPAPPMTEVQLKSKVKARAALKKPGKVTLRLDTMVAGKPRVRHRTAKLSKSLISRPRIAAKSGSGLGVQLEIEGAELGTRVFRPAITGKRIPMPKITAKMRRCADDEGDLHHEIVRGQQHVFSAQQCTAIPATVSVK